MYTYPKDIKDKLEYSRIIEFVKAESLTEMAKTIFDELEILTDLPRIQRLLDETEEYRKSLERGESVPISSFSNVTTDVYYLRKEGYVLELDSIRNIYRMVSIAQELLNYFADSDRVKLNPLLAELVSTIIVDRKLLMEIDRVLDEEGDVRPNASEELMRLTKLIRTREREVDRRFNDFLESMKAKGYLADAPESIRNGRRVLTVTVENKRRVPGIVHDESATGKTVYIEPESVIALNNDVYNLYAERRHEIYKILRALCDFIRPYADALLSTQHTLVKIDTIRSKAKFAYRIYAKKPLLQAEPTLGLKMTFNPILLLRHENQVSSVVPFDLTLHNKNRVLVLSGPNAGGKSVALKTVGLVQMMIQSGLLVPSDENSTYGIFKKIIVDIGDQQSIEDDLSTYSSHLTNMKVTVEQADKDSLILIDEFGSGTDPKIGGAIAEAILANINLKKTWAVITSHYSNLKFFAYKTPGIVNGSMEYDMAKLSPTFRMHIGKPGSSFAFEIAKKIGLDEDILDYAHKKTGKNEKAIDDMLVSLMSEKKEYEEKFAAVLDKQDKLDKLIAQYEHINTDMDIRRKKMKLQIKEITAAKTLEQSKEIDKLLKEIKHSKNEEKVKQAADALKVKKEVELKELEVIKQEVFATESVQTTQRLEIGGFARMRNGSSSGEIISIERGMAELQMGFITVKVPVIDLVSEKEPIQIRSQKSVQTNVDRTDRSDTKIDIREYTKQDALNMLQDFMDRALLNNAFELKIIHGVGTGVMRNEVRKMLKQYKDIKEVWHPPHDQGGDGVTMVKF